MMGSHDFYQEKLISNVKIVTEIQEEQSIISLYKTSNQFWVKNIFMFYFSILPPLTYSLEKNDTICHALCNII